MAISNAIQQDRISSIIGYKLSQIDTRTQSPNAPIRIGVFAEANTANQTTLDSSPWVVTNMKDVGTRYGYGSPIYTICDHLLPVNGGGLSASMIEVYPQPEAPSAAAKVHTITVATTATANTTIYVIISGKRGVRGKSYAVQISVGDTPSVIASKISDTVNNVLGTPVTTTVSTAVVTATAKWKGKSSDFITISIDPGEISHGTTYTIASTTAGAGINTANVVSSLAAIGNKWVNVIISGYSSDDTAIMDAFEAWNGIPDNTNPTGRFVADVWKPAIVIVGSVLDNPSSFTSSRRNNCTIAIAPAPNEKYEPCMVAAEMALLFATTAQNTPHLDVLGKFYPTLDAQFDTGAMSSSSQRDTIVKLGCSTIDKVGEYIKMVDFVTTYRPIGEDIPAYRWCRNLVVDWNIRYAVKLLAENVIIGSAIVNDDVITNASNVIKPETVKSLMIELLTDMSLRGFIADLEYSTKSLQVGISTTNPDRIDIYFRYKRSGVARVVSTDAEAGFNFGNI